MNFIGRTCILAGIVLGMGLGATAQDEPKKTTQEKSSFDKVSFPFEGQVNCDRLNVRLFLGTDKDGIVVSALSSGAKVTVTGEKDDWFQILPPKGCYVWISTTKVKKDSDSEGTVLTNDTPVRLDSRANAEKLAGLNEGDRVTIIKEHMGWYQIQAPDAVKYSVKRKYIEYIGEAKNAVKPNEAKKGDTAKNGDAEANNLVKQADAIVDEVLKALNADAHNVEVSYMPAIELFAKAAETATSADVRKYATERAGKLRDMEQARISAITKWKDAEEERRQKEAALAKKEAPKFEFTGYVDTVGPLWNRPGTHKLMMSDKIVCFIKCKDEATRIKFNGLYQRYVGVKGKVTRDPEGWTGYAVIEVESVEEVIKKD